MDDDDAGITRLVVLRGSEEIGKREVRHAGTVAAAMTCEGRQAKMRGYALLTRPSRPAVESHDTTRSHPAHQGQGRPKRPAAAAGVAPLPLAHRPAHLLRAALRRPRHAEQQAGHAQLHAVPE